MRSYSSSQARETSLDKNSSFTIFLLLFSCSLLLKEPSNSLLYSVPCL